MIYLACPYSHPDASVRHARFVAVSKVAGDLMQQGKIVFSPISHTHPIAVHSNLPLGFDYWEAYDTWFIERAYKLIVLKLDGWIESKGVTAEIKLAHKFGVAVEYMENTLIG